MSFTLPPLPYAYEALEPHIDAATMHLHHDKHHQAYVDKLNAAVAGKPDFENKSVEELLQNLAALPDEIKTAVKNNGGGHINHSVFWTILAPAGQSPSDTFKQAVSVSFQSFDSFKEKLSQAAVNQFGSGWAWLVKDASGKLDIKGYSNQDSPYLDGLTPIVGIDVWEHAYYLKYNNRRADYVAAIWNVFNWAEIDKRLNVKI